MTESKNLPGRPPLATGKRTRKIDARFTEEEYQQIVAMGKELGLSQSELVRKRVLDRAGLVVINAKALLAQIDAVGTELARAGNNINQLAHHANTLRLQGALNNQVISRFDDLMNDYLKHQYQLQVSLRKIIRAMSETDKHLSNR